MPPPAGPYRTRTLDDGTVVPYYIIPFDADGVCTGPLTRQHLLDSVAAGSFTNLFLFSHGWNNDWETATKRYDAFMDGFLRMRNEFALPMPLPYRPLLVGVVWPSTALVFAESEVGPDIAGAGARSVAEQEALEEVAQSVANGDRQRVRDLLSRDRLNQAETLELARLTRPVFATEDHETGARPIADPEEIVELWRSQFAGDRRYGGKVGPVEAADALGPTVTGLLEWLDPRPILRTLTVWQMKDRAGRVGALGVHPLLRDLLQAANARVHLLGHSYGAKVVLSAVGYDGPLPRPAESMLLLQPAVSHLCFAEHVPGSGAPGGYRAILERVVQPVLTTFSDQDVPLHDTFHLALRRNEDLGEAAIAGGDEPPSRYAALGGYGPRLAGERLVAMKLPEQRYAFEDGVRLYGLNGSGIVSGHGDVSNRGTWWALYNQ